jgi:hypothetical protein
MPKRSSSGLFTLPSARRDVELEPHANSDANDSTVCDCENCKTSCAANALHASVSERPLMTLFDADLQLVIAAWKALPAANRKAILALAMSASE